MKLCHNVSSIKSWACLDSTRSSKWRTPAWAQITYHGFSLIHFSGLVCTLPILNSCMKDRWGFLFVRYKKHCCTEMVSWEHAACPLSGIKKCPLVGGWLSISSVVISIGATASVHYREVRLWEGLLLEVPLYTILASCLRISRQSQKLTSSPAVPKAFLEIIHILSMSLTVTARVPVCQTVTFWPTSTHPVTVWHTGENQAASKGSKGKILAVNWVPLGQNSEPFPKQWANK